MTENTTLRAMGGVRQFAWALSAVIAAVALAAAAAWPIYESPRVALAAVGGLVIGTGAVWVAKARKWPWWSAAGLAFGGYVLTVVPLAVPSAMTNPGRIGRGTLNGLGGIVTSWKQLLTVSLPAGNYQGVLIPFFIVVVAGSLTATSLATSGKRRAPWAVAPMLAMVLFGAAFGSDATGADASLGPITVPAPWHVVVGGLSVIVCAAWLIGRARIARSTALRMTRSRARTVQQSAESRVLMVRRQLVAGALVVVALAAGVAAAPVATSLGPRNALRQGIDPVLLLQRQPTPLAGYRLNFTGTGYNAELFAISNPGGVSRIRIATLDTYDGLTFHVGDSATSERFARQPGLQAASVEITIRAGYTGVWVPVVDAAGGAPGFEGERAEKLADAYYASTSLDAGVVVTSDAEAGIGLLPGDRYTVGTSVSTADAASLASATGADPLVSADDYPGLAQWVESQGTGRTGADLAVLVARLRERGYLSHSTFDDAAAAPWIAALTSDSPYTFAPSRSGHSAARVDELFTSMLDQQRRAGSGASPSQLVAAVGDDEQFATAAALLARYLGFESRVVVGVLVGTSTEPTAVPACIHVCTGANVTAWTEVRGADGTWAVFDATPQHQIVPTRIEQGKRLPENPTEVVQPGSKVLEPPSSQSDATESANSNSPQAQATTTSTIATLVTVVAGVLAVALFVLPIAVFPAFKVIRRRWRRRASIAEVSMVGAWDELLDTYTDLGIEIPRGLTRAELGDVIDRPVVAALAAAVDTAVFGEHPPGVEASTATWDLLTAERRSVRAEATLTRRVHAAMTPASFVRTLRAHRRAQSSPRLAGRTSRASRDA